MLKINELNWTFCQYTHKECRALIHSGGELDVNGQYCDLYYVNVLKNDAEDGTSIQELQQSIFSTLHEALEYINNKFHHWKFDNQLAEKKDLGGCGSCVAH